MDSNTIIVEIRAGTGGDEAALFAKELFRMYSRYALKKNWQFQILDSNETGINGFKQVVFKIKGEGAYEKMKQEGGVHRVQRIPKTEKSSRIHTSTISVAVLPMPESKQFAFNMSDIKIDVFKSSGPGGQNVNKRETATRVTHIPTGIVVSSQTARNLEENKNTALNILQAKLLEKEKTERENQISAERRTQIGSADRSEKIRTYNFPQDRITDHRIKKSWGNIEKILDGNLEVIINKFKNNI